LTKLRRSGFYGRKKEFMHATCRQKQSYRLDESTYITAGNALFFEIAVVSPRVI